MSGLEVAAAIFGIIGGVANAYKLVRKIRMRYQKRKNGDSGKEDWNGEEDIERRLKRVEKQLKMSETRLARLNRVSTTRATHEEQYSDMALQNVLKICQQVMAVPMDGAIRSSEALDLLALEQYTERWDMEASLISKGVCPNAIRYRQNLCRFSDVAVEHVAGSEWACRLCGVRVSLASMPFSRSFPYEGLVQIMPNGSFKAHTTGGSNWSCIWKRRSEACSGFFEGRRELLLHMRSVHMRHDSSARELLIDVPADSREHNTARCGYGILHATRSVEIAGDEFVVKFDN